MAKSLATIGDSSLRKQQFLASDSSSSVFDKLTDELLVETLIRLPLKPVHLCKCVSKRCRSLISSSYFVRCYVNRHHSNKSFALYYQLKPTLHNMIRPALMGIDIAYESPIFESLGFSLSFLASNEPLEPETFQYLASNNGLVLCCATLRSPLVYFVCNPLTKQWIVLPPPPSNIKTVYIGFICNAHYEGVEFQLGKKTSFKVVRLEVVNCESPRQLSDTLKLEIFCSEAGTWNEEYLMCDSSPVHEWFNGWNYRCPSAVVVDGVLHWDNLSNCGIFSYDPYSGECRTIELPQGIREPVWAFKHCLGESCGRLRYAHFSWDDTNYRVWELKDYSNGGEWLLLHKVHLDEMKPTADCINKDCMGLLSPHPLDGDIIFFWCRSSSRIVEYHMENRLLKLPCFLQDAKITSFLSPMFFPFVLPCWPTAVPLIQWHDIDYSSM